MSHKERIAAAALAASLVLWGADAEAGKGKPKPVACPGGRFVVEGARLVGAGSVPADALVLAGGQLTSASGCSGAARVKATKKFTLVRATWKSCPGAAGALTVVAKMPAGACDSISGTVKGKKTKRRKFTARVPAAPSLTTGAFVPAPLSANVIGPAGGTIAVTDPSSPLYGLEIVVPPGATSEPITFDVQFADVSASGLPAGANTTSKMIRIIATGSDDWNQYRMFAKPLRVTLPYAAPADGEESVRFYVQNADGSLEPAGLEGQDTGTHRITFHTSVLGDVAEPSRLGLATGRAATASSTFANYVAIGLVADVVTSLFGTPFTVDTGFLPSQNGWYIPNYGSYYKKSRGGSCFGFVGAAKYFYRKRYSPALFASYHDPNDTPTWVDDAVAIEFSSRVHNGMAEIWNQYVTGELNLQTPSSRAVALSFVGGLYVTGTPVLLYIQQAIPQAGGAMAYSGAHAISVYRADLSGGTITFHVYDPNFPGADGRRITYSTDAGFATYLSGTDAASSAFNYNFFKHVGFHVGLSDAALDAIKAAADRGFAGDTIFPKVLITSVSGGRTGTEATEGTTASGEHKYIVDDNSVRIRGTVLGGLAQDACCVVDNARIFLSNKRFSTPVANVAGGGTGEFDQVIPISQGESELVIIAAKKNSFSHWAGFLRDVIESAYSPAAMTVTLSWGQDNSDVDLYVKEPDGDGGTGDSVYYAHRRGRSDTHPYLDFDNTRGYGPEHYIGLNGMRTLYVGGAEAPNLYGDYTVKVHYYADHDSDRENVQPISWDLEWRYLAFCPDPCTNPEDEGFWEEGSSSGVLTGASSGNCCNIGHSGADWSGAITIPYEAPDPADWTVPPPPGVMLP